MFLQFHHESPVLVQFSDFLFQHHIPQTPFSSGYRTASVFRRYNVVTEEELQEVKWKPDEYSGVHIGVHQPRKTREIGSN